jgi:hypothetical protein
VCVCVCVIATCHILTIYDGSRSLETAINIFAALSKHRRIVEFKIITTDYSLMNSSHDPSIPLNNIDVKLPHKRKNIYYFFSFSFLFFNVLKMELFDETKKGERLNKP